MQDEAFAVRFRGESLRRAFLPPQAQIPIYMDIQQFYRSLDILTRGQ
jgi:hypothetical protein